MIDAVGSVLLVAACVWACGRAARLRLVRDTRAGDPLADVTRGGQQLVRKVMARATGGSVLRLVAAVIGGSIAVLVATSVLPWWLEVPAVLVVCWLVGRRRVKSQDWWSHGRLVAAMVAAGILRRPGQGEPPLTLSYRGQPQHSEHGTLVVVSLPAGRTVADVLAKRVALAGALRLPAARLEVSQLDTDPAGVVRLLVTEPGAVREVAADVATADRTAWSAPVRLGRDSHGQAHELETVEANTLIAGVPGSGKTSVARIVVAHYLLDPSTAVYLLDGKGSTAD